MIGSTVARPVGDIIELDGGYYDFTLPSSLPYLTYESITVLMWYYAPKQQST